MRSLLNQLLAAPSRWPLATLLAALIVTWVAAAGTTRLRSDTSLNAMFPENDPAAEAMVRVLDRFGAADELLALVTLPGENDVPDPARLLDYARRLQSEILAKPALVEAVVYRTEPDVERFVERELAPAAIFYLDDAELAAARERLSPGGMARELARDQAMISQPGPAAGALAKALLQDPLNLHEFLVPKLGGSRPFPAYQNSDAYISPDGRAILIRVLGNRPPTDLTYASSLSAFVAAAAERASPGGLRVRFGGAYPIAALSQRSIQRDAIESVISSVALLLGIFVVFYRRPVRFFLLAFLPVAVGTLWGFGAYGLTLHDLSPIAAVIGGVLAGMGIDYSVLYLTRYESIRFTGKSAGEAARQTIGEIAMPLFAAWITSVAGFLAIGGSSVRALRDFSILGTLGLAGSFVAALFVLPALLVLVSGDGGVHKKPIFRFTLEPLIGWVRRRRVALLAGAAVIAVVSGAVAFFPGTGILQAETDLTVMHPRPNAALDAEAEIERRFGIAAGTLLIDLRADDDASLIALSHRVAERLSSPAVKAVGIAGVYGISTWLAEPEVVQRRAQAFTVVQADQIVSDFNAAVARSDFNPASFQSYSSFLHDLLTRQTAPDLATLRKYPSLARDLLPRDFAAGSSEAVTVVFLNVGDENRIARDAAIDAVRGALAGLDGAIPTGLPVIGHDAESAVWHELPRLLWLAGALVAGYLLIHFRNFKRMSLALLPAGFGMIVLAAIVRVLGVRLNMINLVALPLLIGIDVDYGIYLVSLARGKDSSHDDGTDAVPSGAHAVLVCASSMIAGYASLESTSIPAIRSLGLVVAIGVGSCLIGAIFILCPLLQPAQAKQTLPPTPQPPVAA